MGPNIWVRLFRPKFFAVNLFAGGLCLSFVLHHFFSYQRQMLNAFSLLQS